MHKRPLSPDQARRHFRSLSDDEALRALQALQQLAAGLDEEPPALPHPAPSSQERGTLSWRTRPAAQPTRPGLLR